MRTLDNKVYCGYCGRKVHLKALARHWKLLSHPGDEHQPLYEGDQPAQQWRDQWQDAVHRPANEDG